MGKAKRERVLSDTEAKAELNTVRISAQTGSTRLPACRRWR